MKELCKEVKTRLELVNHRLNALERERIQLLTEQEHLAELNELYKNLEYDPITEERRVTENMLHEKKISEFKPVEHVQRKHHKTKTSNYTEPLEIIFTSLPNPIKFDVICTNLNDLLQQDIPKNNTVNILKTQIRHGFLKKVERGLYTWIGGKQNDTTEAIPAGGCPKTQTI